MGNWGAPCGPARRGASKPAPPGPRARQDAPLRAPTRGKAGCREGAGPRHLFPEVRDGVLHLQNKVPEVVRPGDLRVLIGGGRGIPGAPAVLPDTAGGRGGSRHDLSMHSALTTHVHITGHHTPCPSRARGRVGGRRDVPGHAQDPPSSADGLTSGTAVPPGLPRPCFRDGLVLLVAEVQGPPASEMIREGVELSPGPAV